MIQDKEGFFYPLVNEKECIGCGLCRSVCIYKATLPYTNDLKETYACYNRNDKVRTASSSGGVFSVIADEIIKRSGVVYGVTMSGDCRRAVFFRATNKKELEKMRGSKYIQAEPSLVFQEIRHELEDGKDVLFSGTPCQVNALHLFLNKKFERLICVDIICHGVPSQKIWNKYVDEIEQKYHAKVVSVNFRSKDVSWHEFGIKYIDNEKREIFSSKDKNAYMQFFLRNYSLRPCCYCCLSKTVRMADMTIGDFWGIGTVNPDMDDGKGNSLVIVRSGSGQRLFNMIKRDLVITRTEYDKAIRWNLAEYGSVPIPKKREVFWKDADVMTMRQLQKKYGSVDLMTVGKRILRKIVLLGMGG